MPKIISPSILSADFSNLQAACEMVNTSKAEWLHIDVMDGVFVPNISFGFPIMKAVKKHAKRPLDVHLMIIDPDKYIERFAEAGANIITVHLETLKNPVKTLKKMRELGVKVGITINPDIEVNKLKGLVKYVDLVLLMSVFAGYGGQKFIDKTFERLEELKTIIAEENSDCLIEVDGGVNTENAPKLFDAGVDILVAGSAIFKSEDPQKTIEQLLR